MNSMLNFFGQQNPLMAFFANVSNWWNQYRQFTVNPVGAIMSMKGVNVPANFSGSSEDLARHLLNTGQMSQEQFRQFSQLADQMHRMLPKF